MDEFGVLTERFGLKPQGKSAPMASSRTAQTGNFGLNHTHNSKSGFSSNTYNGSFDDGREDLFTTTKSGTFGASGDHFDIFGDFHRNSGSSSAKTSLDDDIFGVFGGSNSGSKNIGDVENDIFGSFSSTSTNNPKKQNGGGVVDDLLGNSGTPPSSNGSVGFGFDDDLISGFGSSSTGNKGKNTGTAKPASSSADDPFFNLESFSTTSESTFIDPLEELSQLNQSGKRKPAASSNAFSSTLKPPPKPGQVLKTEKAKNLGASLLDDLEDLVSGRARRNVDNRSYSSEARERKSTKSSKYKEAEDTKCQSQQNSADDLDIIFGMSSRSSSVPKSRATTLDPLFDSKTKGGGKPNVINKASSKEASTPKNFLDDLSFAFEGASMFGDFEEVEGESEERRRARIGRHQRTQDRVARAVADMNHREFQTQHEQEERSRIADNVDTMIKGWAAGKEGNMRALLSSVQYVLWPECGWEPVSLTDLITSTSVKKVYRKATLCVHPDKVQQKGATLEQKYTAEKVFDILKEAWNKFSKEELS